ncbi:MAG: M14 family metallopeptidase [Candidatus Thermoplasmatota archaeon]
MNVQNTLYQRPLLWGILFLLCIGHLHPIHPAVPATQTSNDIDVYHYLTYQEMTELLFNLQKQYPEIFHLTSLGTTYQGRNIWQVTLSDHPEEQEDEPGVLIMGAHHGNEKPSYEIPLFFVRYIVDNYYQPTTDNDGDGVFDEDEFDGRDNDGDGRIDEDPSEDYVRHIVNTTQIYIIPMVNPDGVEADSRKNCAPNYGPFGFKKTITSYGVNLNRNYGYKWYLYYLFPTRYSLFFNMRDSSYNYRGPYPFSENETKAVKAFVETHHTIRISLSYHTYGEFILYPWDHASQVTPDESLFLSIGENISRINQYYLYTGKSTIRPGYGGTIGTSEDWLYGAHNILSFTIELCKERAPSSQSIMDAVCRTHVGVHLYICERAVQLGSEQ